MSNSPLVDIIIPSPHHSGRRTQPIRKITLHHMAGVLSVETCGAIFAHPTRYASSNYGIDNTGRVGQYVDEGNRSWCSSSPSNDQQAVTVEISNLETGGQWPIGEIALAKTLDLCTDICRRNDIPELIWTGDASGTLTTHDMFSNTLCPGPHLKSLMPWIAEEVTRRIKAPDPAQFSRVQVGAFKDRNRAIALRDELRKKGYTDAFVPPLVNDPPEVPAPAAPTIKLGSTVRIRKGARDWNGTLLYPGAYDRTYSVLEMAGKRAVIGIGGVVTAAFHTDALFIA